MNLGWTDPSALTLAEAIPDREVVLNGDYDVQAKQILYYDLEPRVHRRSA